MLLDRLNDNLPPYIVDCFQKAGFDSVDAIDGMDGDTIIEEMEQYTDKRKHHYPSCMGPDGVPELPFEFHQEQSSH